MAFIKKIIKTITQPIINKYKGRLGETKVKRILNPLIFGRVKHKQINNLTLIDNNGKSHQIDHVEIRKNGIFCIETKNYIGWIFGDEFQDHWTQSLYTGEKHQFINPLKQNKSHIYHLSRVLGGKYKINSIVVMVQNNADKINCTNVVNLADLSLYLKDYYDGTNYTIEEIKGIYDKIRAAKTKISHRAHLSNIKKTQRELKQSICPRCGAKLLERCGPYGKFLGCSNYPKCKFILKK